METNITNKKFKSTIRPSQRGKAYLTGQVDLIKQIRMFWLSEQFKNHFKNIGITFERWIDIQLELIEKERSNL